MVCFMKKRIVAGLICLLVLLGCVSCARERHDLLYSTEQGDLTFCVRGNTTRPKQIVVKRGEEILLAQKIKVDSSVGSLDGSYGLTVLDLNFDGHNDVMVANDVFGECVSYLCWLWDNENSQFVKSESLSGLCNISVNTEKKSVFAFSHTFERERAYLDVPETTIATDITTKYVWTDGVLTPNIRISLTHYSETEMYCLSIAYYDTEAKQFSIDNTKEDWIKASEIGEYDLSELY